MKNITARRFLMALAVILTVTLAMCTDDTHKHIKNLKKYGQVSVEGKKLRFYDNDNTRTPWERESLQYLGKKYDVRYIPKRFNY